MQTCVVCEGNGWVAPRGGARIACRRCGGAGKVAVEPEAPRAVHHAEPTMAADERAEIEKLLPALDQVCEVAYIHVQELEQGRELIGAAAWRLTFELLRGERLRLTVLLRGAGNGQGGGVIQIVPSTDPRAGGV